MSSDYLGNFFDVTVAFGVVYMKPFDPAPFQNVYLSLGFVLSVCAVI